MNIKRLFKNDDAVSPVIGVILMVAITVILAAVIASFVLGLGNQQETAPNVSFEFNFQEESSANYLEVTKSGGDAVDGSNLYMRGSNPPSTVSQSNDIASQTTSGGNPDSISGWTSGEIGAGQGFNVTSGVPTDYEITLVYETGDTSEELISDSGPDA
jgi:flagellin-like protein